MYLGSLYVLLNLDTEVSSFDRERVLRSLRERLKSTFGQRVTVRSEADSALAIAFLDDDLERLRGRSEAVLSRLEEAGEARILSSTRQIFAWTEGEFRELEHERDYDDAPEASQNLVGSPMGRRGGRTTEVSRDYDDILDRDALLEEFGRRPVRRNMRLPVRK